MTGDDGVGVHPLGALMRRFAVDWLDRADASVPGEIMAPGYTILIGGYALEGRDAYVEATSGQLARFPGLTITVHDAAYTPDGRAVLRFTEHGASARGGAAAWRGIGLFRASDDGRGVLTHNACEEDYFGRRRQLQAGVADPVDPPMVAPWTEPPAAPDPDAEKAVRAWLEAGGSMTPGMVVDDGSPAETLLEVEGCEVDECFAAGRRVAFHATQRGRRDGAAVTLGVAGLVDVGAGGTITGHVVRDRLGLHRALTR